MPIILGVDLGTTKITSLALDTDSGSIVATAFTANEANITSGEDRARNRSEWDAERIAVAARQCLTDITQKLGPQAKDVAGLGITGQQHGMVLVDRRRKPVTPLINWQDRRALDRQPDRDITWLQSAREAIGSDTWKRTGCQLHPGFMAVTLYELSQQKTLPADGQALFIMDYFTASLTGQPAVTEPSCAGSSGVFNVRTRNWDADAIQALGLPTSLFPEVREAHEIVGTLTAEQATAIGLTAGIPVFAGIGDHQASFLGSVADRHNSILVNVGTGAQVAVFTDSYEFAAPVELRPFPCGGNLLSNVGLAGGWSYQVLEQFYRDVGRHLFESGSSEKLYEALNRLAEEIPAGADGLVCEPRFSGTRLDPSVRGSITGISPANFTAGHLARAVLEGMGRSLHDGFKAIEQITRQQPDKLVAAGNGLRENPLLSRIVSQAFDRTMSFTQYREEAAFGATLVAAVGAGIYPNLDAAASRLIRLTETALP